MRIYLHNWVQLFELYSSYGKYCPSSNATNKLNVVLSFQNLKKINIVYIFFRHIFLYKVIFSISKVSHSLFFFLTSRPLFGIYPYFLYPLLMPISGKSYPPSQQRKGEETMCNHAKLTI